MRLRGIFTVWALAAAAPLLAQEPARPDIQVISAAAPLQIYHDHSTAQITAMRHIRFPSPHMHSPGITVAESELKTSYELKFRPRPHSTQYEFWATSVTVVFDYVRMDVYISSQYGEGSCEYNQILAHEKQHVAIDEQTLEKYKNRMAYALKHSRLIPTAFRPLVARSPEEGKAILTKRVLGIVNPYFKQYHHEVRVRNAWIDSPANYHRVQARCNGW
ncbi:MAG TPA: hypothetical protein VMU88_07750 [bacterium]|nr:hypothetical protein [bacterium]